MNNSKDKQDLQSKDDHDQNQQQHNNEQDQQQIQDQNDSGFNIQQENVDEEVIVMDEKKENEINDQNKEAQNNDQENKTDQKKCLKKKKYSKHYNKLFKQQNNHIFFKMNDPIEKFQIRGEGVYFYFYFIKYFAIIFILAGIISLGSLIINIKGNGLQSSGLQILLKTTIGNQEKVRFNKDKIQQLKKLTPSERMKFIKEENSHLHMYQLVHMYSDFIINLLFFISIYVFQYMVNKKSQQINEVYPSIRNHTVMVKGIGGKNNQRQKIKEYFNKFGHVEQIDFAYTYNNSLYNLVKVSENYNKILEIQNKDTTEKKKIKKFNKKYKKLKKHIKAIMDKNNQKSFNFRFFNNFDIVYTFVTFNHNKTPLKVTSQFEQEYKKSYKQILMCQKKEIKKEFKYEGKQLQISIPDHPQNIVWENMEFTKSYRRKRKLFLVVVSFALILISFIANLVLTALQEDSHEVSCDNSEITLETVKAATGQYKMEIIHCYCEQFSFFHFFQNQNTDEFKYCEPFYIGQLEFFAINIGIGFLISITNYIIEIIIIKCTELIKYEQLTKLISQQMIYTFIVEYINTAFILLFIYAEINGFAIIRYFNQIIEHNVFKIHNFISSFNRKWYENVGSNLITPLFISVFSPHLIDFAYVILKKIYYRRYKKKELEKEDFDVGSNLKEILKLVIICHTFSSGILIYYHFIYAGLIVMYWTQKYMFVYNSLIPPPLSKKFIQRVYPLLKITLLIHMVFSVLFYSNDDIFPKGVNVQLDQSKPHRPEPEFTFTDMLERTLPIVIQICLFLFIYLLEMMFDKPFIFFTRLFFKEEKLKKIESLEINRESREMKKNKNYKYDIMVNSKYEEVFDLQDEKLQKIKDIIKESTLQDIVQFKSMKNFRQQSKEFTKLVSIEMETLKKKHQLIIYYNISFNVLFVCKKILEYLNKNLIIRLKIKILNKKFQKRNQLLKYIFATTQNKIKLQKSIILQRKMVRKKNRQLKQIQKRFSMFLKKFKIQQINTISFEFSQKSN